MASKPIGKKSGSSNSKGGAGKQVQTLVHEGAKRKNIPTAEYQGMLGKGDPDFRHAYERRNQDLDPQLVWRGKDEQDWSDLVVDVPPLYIQEKIHPKALIDDLLRQTREDRHEAGEQEADLFADFNGIPKGVDKTEFYQHDQNWSNRMILGDSLQVMASLAEREGLRGKVQCIYVDPPYGIKFNSNFQWSTTSRDVKDGNASHITREPEQVKAFRDTWRHGIHSYLTYLRDRFTVARDLLAETGSIFVQIGDSNVHRVRALLDEVFGDDNFVAQVTYRVKSPLAVSDLARTTDFILWYARDANAMKFRQARKPKRIEEHPEFTLALRRDGAVINRGEAQQEPDQSSLGYFTAQNLASSGYTPSCMFDVTVNGRLYSIPKGKSWKTNKEGMRRLLRAGRLEPLKTSLRWRYFFDDAPSEVITDVWMDTFSATDKTYVVQTSESVVQRCVLMVTDPGDLVLDPTCGSGTTAFVSEQWGRRWITIDTSRVALALARARLMGSQYDYYLLADSLPGRIKEAELTGRANSLEPTRNDVRLGFVYQRVPHVTLRAIANNAEIDAIWEKWEPQITNLRHALLSHLSKALEEWEIPVQAPDRWTRSAQNAHKEWRHAILSRQAELDASIRSKADTEYLFDKPYIDTTRIRVAGPFTVESLSPHRTLAVDENDEIVHGVTEQIAGYSAGRDFVSLILENLRIAGVQQAVKSDRISFSSLVAWPGAYVCAEGIYFEHERERRAAVMIGPEFGTVTRPDLVAAAREAAEAGFDVLVACAFNFEAHTTEFSKLGKVPVLKARMNADLHMGAELTRTNKANLFVIFGEPDMTVLPRNDGRIQVRLNGVDVFDPNTGEVRSDSTAGIACWFIDTDYNEESFFVRHAYFLGANDPYEALRSTLRAKIDKGAWESLYSDTSRPFERPTTGRIAVKVINHLGDEVMKVFRV